MSPFQAVYYRAADGSEPVHDLLESLDKKRRVSLHNQIHLFRKRTKKLPISEVEIARTRWQDFQARMNPPPSRKPRAAGHDAP
jgi:hypothetical protein